MHVNIFCHLITLSKLLILVLLVTNCANAKWCKNRKMTEKPWYMGTHLRVLSKGYLINANMRRFRFF